MIPTVYIETSVISYLASNPSRDLLTAAHQQITHFWWRARRPSFDLFVSQLVLDECIAGNSAAAERRTALLANLSLLDIDAEAASLARYFAEKVPLPERAVADALHIATAVRHGIDYLLTWNCKHIANAELRRRIDGVCTLLVDMRQRFYAHRRN